MMFKKMSCFFLLFIFAAAAWASEPSPYAGQESRQIKALSPVEIESYLAGKGMGFSKAAELNHYPGPKHVLEQADKLGLTEEQLAKTRKIYNTMHAEAVRLGRLIVEKEHLLETMFAGQAAISAEVRKVVSGIAQYRGELRMVHINAHIAQKDILTQEQVRRYDDLRGYSSGGHGGHQHRHAH
ncbi:MAG: hypothetical protein GY862_01725 [Gammaproteobacteria bacterium]|nr:hypothetical protein [Gammaproteobacteria bacterium]